MIIELGSVTETTLGPATSVVESNELSPGPFPG